MLDILLFIYLFYLGFALAVSVYRQWLKGALNPLNKVLFAPVLITFIVLDVVLNYTIFLVLLGPAPPKCYTISTRLAEYRKVQDGSWNDWIANFICEKLLNTVDPIGKHC